MRWLSSARACVCAHTRARCGFVPRSIIALCETNVDVSLIPCLAFRRRTHTATGPRPGFAAAAIYCLTIAKSPRRQKIFFLRRLAATSARRCSQYPASELRPPPMGIMTFRRKEEVSNKVFGGQLRRGPRRRQKHTS